MEKLKQLARYLAVQKVPLYAANASFFLVLSVFPVLVVLLALMRYTGLQVETFTDLVAGVVPGALMPMVNQLVLSAYVNSTGAVLSVSAVAALWSASRGMYSFVTGLNAIYEVQENRGYFRTRFISMGYTFAFLLVLLLTLVLHVFGGDLLQLLGDLPIPEFLRNLLDLRVFVLLILQTALFCAMFVVLPNEKNGLGESIPGALLASIGWQIFTNVYSVYSQKFTAYASIYGSVYVVALGMLWLYFCICSEDTVSHLLKDPYISRQSYPLHLVRSACRLYPE